MGDKPFVVRPATSADWPQAARIMTKAFYDDPVIGGVIHPYRHKRSEDMDIFWIHEFRLAAVKPLSQVDVVYHQDDPDRLIGVSLWLRKSPNLNHSPETAQAIKTVEAFNELENAILPNMAVDPDNYLIFDRCIPYTAHHWTGDRAESHYLSFLAVDPACQVRGYGRALVNAGLEYARKQGISASVKAQAGCEGFYEACGFEIVAGADPGTPGYPLRGAPEAIVLFKDFQRA